MPKNLKRYYGKHDLHFVTCTCYRRMPLLSSARSKGVFAKILGEVREPHPLRAAKDGPPNVNGLSHKRCCEFKCVPPSDYSETSRLSSGSPDSGLSVKRNDNARSNRLLLLNVTLRVTGLYPGITTSAKAKKPKTDTSSVTPAVTETNTKPRYPRCHARIGAAKNAPNQTIGKLLVSNFNSVPQDGHEKVGSHENPLGGMTVPQTGHGCAYLEVMNRGFPSPVHRKFGYLA